jgi:hypothetical protein
MARADRRSNHRSHRRPLAALLASMVTSGVLAQTAPPPGSPSDVNYTPVQGATSALFPRQEADARPLAVAASPVGRVVVEAHANGLPADGQSVVRLTLRLFGRDGRPLAETTAVTLEHSGGRLRLPGARSDEFGPRAQDADRAHPGVQLLVRQGLAEVELVAPAEAQDVRVRVSAGGEAAQGVVAFVPDLRPMIAAGLLEGVVSLPPQAHRSSRCAAATPSSRRSPPGRATSTGGKVQCAAARAAFFLKGTISRRSCC